MILILALRGQADLCEFKVSLVYRVSSRTGSKDTHRNPVSKNQKLMELISKNKHTITFIAYFNFHLGKF